MAMPTWILEVQAIGSVAGAIAAGVIAYAGVQIASRTAEQKLPLDMFPLRYAVYDAVLMALRDAVNADTTKEAEARVWFAKEKVREARFLFKCETFDYLDTLDIKIFEQSHLARTISHTTDDHLVADLRDKQDKNAQWLLPQLQGGLAKMLEAELKVDATSTFSLEFRSKPAS